ncbi:MAG: hypothetical protein HQM00_12990 [Magnetococcales bacterium]|nr:hypothetical protein [Magnetococcales bacterium]
MNILNAAGFLIQRAVQTATQLQQQNREKETRTVSAPAREKSAGAALGDPAVTPVRSSAYRVTLSAAAQQRLSMNQAA